jgi:beta-lactamase regulating signal transducer with metallopeptidase domain
MSPLLRYYPGDRSLDFLLVVTLVVALASSAAWLLSRRLARQPALRHLVLFSALIGCLASPAVAWLCGAVGLTLVSIPLLHAEEGRMASGVTPMEADPGWTPPRPPADPPSAGPPLPHTNTTIDPSAEVAAASVANESPVACMPSAPDVQRTGSPAGTLVSFRGIATGAMFVWAAGVLLLLLRLARNGGRVMQLRRSSHPLENEAHQRLLQEIAARLGMRRAPLLLVSSRPVAPLAVGFGRPAIILPERLLGAVSENELRDVLLHEAAHLQRSDQWIVLLQELAGALYWPIVSVYALNRELRRAREEICDNLVLAGRDAISYGRTLLHVAELLVQARPMGAAAGILGGPGKLERRIAELIDPRRNTMTAAGRTAAFVVMFVFIAGVAIASATRFAARALADQPVPAAQKPQTAADPDDPQLAGHFSGRVHGPDGKPLSGAQVFIVPVYGANKEAGPVRARTDADGRFEFDAADMTYTEQDGLPARREGLLMAAKDGYAPDWLPTWGHRTGLGFRTHWDPIKGADVSLHLAKDDVPIHGRFLDPDGRPLKDARVRLTELMIPRQRDLDAHLAFMTNLGDAYLLVSIDYERNLYQPRFLPRLTTETRTDADGRFTMSGLGRDRLAVLHVSAPSVVDTTLTVMTRNAPDVVLSPQAGGKATDVIHGAGFTLQLRRGLTVKGLVRDRDTREPIPGMWVTWHRDPMRDPAAAVEAPVTDEKGRFTISGLYPELFDWDKTNHVLTAFPRPGGQYLVSEGYIEPGADVVIECMRGIPFRLKLVDEQGKPVEANVDYHYIAPNPEVEDLIKPFLSGCNWPLANGAARRADGIYEGVVLPGPGAVLVKTPGRSYRPAHVDPKAFFAPGRTEWTAQEQISTYGTHNTLQIGGEWTDQHDYAAIVLVNPARNAAPLELSATVVDDKPRRISLIDPDGKPVVGAQSEGLTWFPWSASPTLRAASFPVTKLHPDRARRITFVQEERQLIGFLMARGDGETPYTVRMQPWGTVTGQLVDETGSLSDVAFLSLRGDGGFDPNPDPEVGEYAHVEIDKTGRFRVDHLIPGQRYRAEVYRGTAKLAGMAFENLVVRPGEVRDLGAISPKPPIKKK